MIGKTFLHFRGGLEPGFAGRDFGWSDDGQQSAGTNGVYRAMMQMLLGAEEMHVVCGHKRHAEFAAKPFGFAQYAAVAGREMLYLDV